jgi:hypothetical protein
MQACIPQKWSQSRLKNEQHLPKQKTQWFMHRQKQDGRRAQTISPRNLR